MKRWLTMKRLLTFIMVFSVTVVLYGNKTDVNKWQSVTKKKYPNAHEVLLNEFIKTKYDTLGKYKANDDVYLKILDEKGLQENQVLKLQYDRSYGKYDVEKVELIKPDGKHIEINVKLNMKDQVAPGGASMNIYDPNERLITIQIPGINVGDILHYEIKYKEFNPRQKGQFSDFEFGQYKYPYLHMKYVLIAPKTDPLKKFVILDGIKSHYDTSTVKTDSTIIYTFEVHDVPQIIPEPSMPSITRVAMRMLVSTIGSWKVISRWNYNLVQKHLKINEDIRKKVDELTKGKTDEISKIRAIFFYVSRNIRYMGVTTEKNKPGLEPHDVVYTFETGTGVCRDKAALIVAMLRYAGIDANPVLFSVGPKLDKEVPLDYFNHEIAGVRLKNGKEILIDPTDETGNTLFPQYEADMSYLLCTKEGDTLKTSPFIPAKVNNINVKTDVVYKSNKFYCNSTITFYGINDNIFRGYFARLNRNRLEEFINSIVKKVATDSKVDTFEVLPKNLLGSREHLRIKIQYVVNDPTVGDKNIRMFQLPFIGSKIGIFKWALGDISLRERHYPFKAHFTSSLSENVTFKDMNTGKLKVLYMPSKITIDKDGYTYKSLSDINGNTINVKKYYAIDKLEYSPKEYKRLKKYLKEGENNNKKYIIIKE